MSVTQEQFETILALLSEGKPLAVICRMDGMPARQRVYEYRDADKTGERAGLIARARDLGEDALGEECLEIADDARNDWMESNHGDESGWKVNGENVQRSKLRIWTRLQLLAKWNPKKYGDKIDLNHGGAVTVTVNDADEKL